MLFAPDGSVLSPGASDDVDRGIVFLREQVAAGITTFFLGHGSVGFALLVASPKRFDMGAGVAIGVQLSTVNLAALRNQCLELLGERDAGEPTRLHAQGSIVVDDGQADDIDSGFRHLSGEVGSGRTAFYLGRGGPQGYILLVGSPKCFDVGRGIGIGVGLSAAGLRSLRSRVVELLHGKRAAESFGKV
jgi:hypothetical protein